MQEQYWSTLRGENEGGTIANPDVYLRELEPFGDSGGNGDNEKSSARKLAAGAQTMAGWSMVSVMGLFLTALYL